MATDGAVRDNAEPGPLRDEVLKRLAEILDAQLSESDLRALKDTGAGNYDYLTDGFETHIKTRIIKMIPGRQSQMRA